MLVGVIIGDRSPSSAFSGSDDRSEAKWLIEGDGKKGQLSIGGNIGREREREREGTQTRSSLSIVEITIV